MIRISGVGSSRPENIVTNADLEQLMETSDQWIQQRSGIKQRCWSRSLSDLHGGGPRNSEMALEAAKQALDSSEVDLDKIDAVFYSTISSDYDYPGCGAALLGGLGVGRALPVFEIRNHCSGFLYGMLGAHAYLKNQSLNSVLVIGVELQSTGLDVTTAGRDTAVLFGDGAGAVVLARSDDPQRGIIDIELESDGAFAQSLGVCAPSFARSVPICPADFEVQDRSAFPRMDGKLVFKMASSQMPRTVRNLLERNGLGIDDLKLVIPHQANQRIMDMLGRDLAAPEKIFSVIDQYGNTTAASIPIALWHAANSANLQPGDLICLVSFGAGFSWGGVLLRW